MLLTNGSKYNIFNSEHTIRDDLIIKNPIPISNIDKLEKLYLVIKYTTEFLEKHNIDYCIESGTLIGCVRHDGIIPWDDDVDIMIFKEGYFKLKKLMNKYNNENHKILHITPGFKLFYDNESYGELFLYDLDKKNGVYRMAFPYIDNKPTFYTGKLYFDYQRFNEEDIFPTKKTLFEDFYVRTPNNIKNILKTTYTNNLLECVYCPDKNAQHASLKLIHYKIVEVIENITCNKILIFLYIFIHWLASRKLVTIF